MTPAWTTDAATDDPTRAVRLTLLWGLEGVVLRTVGGGRVPNVTEGPLRRRLQEAELDVVALDPGLFEGAATARAAWLNDLDRLSEVATFGERFGCSLVRIGALGAPGGFDPVLAAEALRQAGERAASLGLRLAVRNEAGGAVATGADLAALLGAVGHSAVCADWRPADALQAGEDPARGLGALTTAGVSVACVGVRDGRVGERTWDDEVVGEGDVGWDPHLVALALAGVEGPLVIDALPEPARTTGLASATALIRSSRRAQREAGRG